MPELNTDRPGQVLPTPGQPAMLAGDVGALERALNCRRQREPAEGGFRAILQKQACRSAACPGQLLWHSFRLLRRRSDRVVVGTADFRAPPAKAGCVETGCGLGSAHWGRGCTTEAVAALRALAKAQPEVRRVFAGAEAYNAASRRVPARCGFVQAVPGPTDRWEP